MSHISQNDKRMAMERAIVSRLVQTALAAGWSVPAVWDGEDTVSCTSEQDVLEAVFSVDESTIKFRKGREVHSALIVLGNDGYDCISDTSVNGSAPGAADFEGEVLGPTEAFAQTLQEAAESSAPAMG